MNPADFPDAWHRLAAERGRRFTVDVEAKDKERAVLAIRDAIADATPDETTTTAPRRRRATPAAAAPAAPAAR